MQQQTQKKSVFSNLRLLFHLNYVEGELSFLQENYSESVAREGLAYFREKKRKVS